MKTICGKCGKILTDESGRHESAIFDSALAQTRFVGDDVYALCEPCWTKLRQQENKS